MRHQTLWPYTIKRFQRKSRQRWNSPMKSFLSVFPKHQHYQKKGRLLPQSITVVPMSLHGFYAKQTVNAKRVGATPRSRSDQMGLHILKCITRYRFAMAERTLRIMLWHFARTVTVKLTTDKEVDSMAAEQRDADRMSAFHNVDMASSQHDHLKPGTGYAGCPRVTGSATPFLIRKSRILAR
jgi:hypothetical protein